MTGTVVKILSFEYYVKDDITGEAVLCRGRGRLKRDGDILVGDKVEYATGSKSASIEKVLPRRNALVRPYVANIDSAIIVIAPVPKPDYYLVDKIIVNCYKDKIEPIICVNKTDLLSEKEAEKLTNGYEDIKRLYVSAEKGIGLTELLAEMRGRLTCLAGQSAVGKTSLLNALTGSDKAIGELSQRIERGKNTTRHTEIYALDNTTMLIDTCGFSLLELDIEPQELKLYYDEFVSQNENCRYTSCVHVTEPECAVKLAVERGEIDKARYDRYVELYNELKQKRSKRYE